MTIDIVHYQTHTQGPVEDLANTDIGPLLDRITDIRETEENRYEVTPRWVGGSLSEGLGHRYPYATVYRVLSDESAPNFHTNYLHLVFDIDERVSLNPDTLASLVQHLKEHIETLLTDVFGGFLIKMENHGTALVAVVYGYHTDLFDQLQTIEHHDG